MASSTSFSKLSLPQAPSRHPHQHSTVNETLPLLSTDVSSQPPDQRSVDRKDELHGYFLMAISTLGFCAQSLFVHIAEESYHFPVASTIFIRAIVQTLFSCLYLIRFTDMPNLFSSLTRTQWKLLAFRGITGSLAMYALFAALRLLPVGDAITIYFFTPVITMALSSIVLHERIAFIHAIAAVISFIGVILVSRPDFGLSSTPLVTVSDRVFGALLALASAFLSSAVYVTIRHLGTSIHYMLSVFSLGVACFLTSSLAGGIIGPRALIANKEGASAVLLSTFFAFAGQTTFNKGLQHCRAGPGALIRSLDVPMTYILAMVFLHEEPTVIRIIGSGLVLLASVMIGLRQIFRS